MIEIRIGDRVVSRHRSVRRANEALLSASGNSRALVTQVDTRTGVVVTPSTLADTSRPQHPRATEKSHWANCPTVRN